MGFMARIFGAVFKEELKGLSLGSDVYWEVSPPSDFPSLLHALHHIVPDNAILYLEGGQPPKEIKQFLEARCVPEVTHIAIGTLWPRPQVFHLPATPENLSQLAELTKQCCPPQVAVHLHVYSDSAMLLEWYDAFSKDPMYLSKEVSEDRIKAFCSDLSVKFKRLGENVEAKN